MKSKNFIVRAILILFLSIMLFVLTGCGEEIKAGVDEYQKSKDILDGSSLDAVREQTEQLQEEYGK